MPVLPWYSPPSGYCARSQPEAPPDYAWIAASSQTDQAPSSTSSAAPLATSSAVVTPSHQAWTKEALLIIAIVLGGLVVFSLFFAILGRIIGLNQRWKDIDLHVRGVAIPQPPRSPTTAVEQSGPYGQHGGSASTLFTTRRIIPTLPQKKGRRPIDSSSTIFNSHSEPRVTAQVDTERGYDEVNLREGNAARRVSGQSTTSSRVWRWIKSSFTGSAQHQEEESSLGLPRRADLQSFLRPTPTGHTPWLIPFVNAANAVAPFTAPPPDLMAAPRGYTLFDADRAASNRLAALPRRSQPETRVASWREDVPDFVADSVRKEQRKQSQWHRRQPSTLDQEGSSSYLLSCGSGSKATDIGRQTSYNYRATSLAMAPGPSEPSRRLASAHVLEAGRNGVRHRLVSQQQQLRAAPAVIISSAEPSEPSVYSKESAPLSEEEQTRQILQRLERGFSTRSEAEEVIADSPTLTEGNGLLSPAIVKNGRVEVAGKLLHDARERAARSSKRTSTDSRTASSRACHTLGSSVDESREAGPSCYRLSEALLAALSPHLPESGARLCHDPCPPDRSSSPSLVVGTTTSEEGSDEAKEAVYGSKAIEVSPTLMVSTLGKGKDAEVHSAVVGAGTGHQYVNCLSLPQRVFLPDEAKSARSYPSDDADITARGGPTPSRSNIPSKHQRRESSISPAPGSLVRDVPAASTPPRASGRALLVTSPAASSPTSASVSPLKGAPEAMATLRRIAPLASLIPAGMSSPPAASSRASSRTGGKRRVVR
ncbi:hypothetical protein BCV69DRAFT_312150 [Microstroma glucosiphilum]|uniref:Uncharacterized protein n=1 Tax=Pseudomicrostroma glucosiphilum TaxID=1684307 RepID=A0A316U8Z8_9BASI|nr:hypothetical protein BCV69DRAFT_312150 [Pseudomicrostroma glucosiphilum]PWN21659.1 hypothetical protein BCV69DRAFT_312150 [Pseudomicrostroma glucosiphilum]